MRNILLITLFALISGCYTTFNRVNFYSDGDDSSIEFFEDTGLSSYKYYDDGFYGVWRSPYQYYGGYNSAPYLYYPYYPDMYGYYGAGFYCQPYSYYPYGYKYRHFSGGYRYNPPVEKHNYAARTFTKRRQIPVSVSSAPQKPGTIRRRSRLPANNTGSATAYNPPRTGSDTKRSTIKPVHTARPKVKTGSGKNARISAAKAGRKRYTSSGHSKNPARKSASSSSKSSKKSKQRRRR